MTLQLLATAQSCLLGEVGVGCASYAGFGRVQSVSRGKVLNKCILQPGAATACLLGELGAGGWGRGIAFSRLAVQQAAYVSCSASPSKCAVHCISPLLCFSPLLCCSYATLALANHQTTNHQLLQQSQGVCLCPAAHLAATCQQSRSARHLPPPTGYSSSRRSSSNNRCRCSSKSSSQADMGRL